MATTMKNLLTLMNDEDAQDYLGMLYHSRKRPTDLYQSLPYEDISTPRYKPSLTPNFVDASYLGVGGYNQFNPNVKGTTTRRPGMTNYEVDQANFAGLDVRPRNYTRSFEDDNARTTRADLAQYAPSNTSIPFATHVGPTREEIFNTQVPPTRSFEGPHARTLRKSLASDYYNPPPTSIPIGLGRSPGPGSLSIYEFDPNRVIWDSSEYKSEPDIKGVSLIKNPKTIKPEKSIEAEEGPSSWWDTALKMIQEAGVSAGDERGTAFAAGGGFAKSPEPFITGPNSIMTMAPLYLNRKEKR